MHAIGLAGDAASRVHRLDPRAKLAGLIGITVVGVSAPPQAWPVLAACVLALVAIAVAGRIGPGVICSRAKVALPPVLLVAVLTPLVHGGFQTFAAVGAKALIGTVSAVLLGATTTFPDALHGLERMRAPRLLTLIAGFMYRYLFVIAGEARRMRVALAARGYRPRHALQAAALGRVAIALFLRAFERGERVHLAMLARGYAGTTPRLGALAFARADVLFLSALAAALVPLRVIIEVL